MIFEYVKYRFCFFYQGVVKVISRRRLRPLMRTALSLMVMAAMGSSSVVAYADETNQKEISVVEPDETVYEIGEPENGESEGDIEEEAELGESVDEELYNIFPFDELEKETSEQPDADGKPVCFFLRKEIDSAIPNEPAGHPSSEYSDAIRVDGAAYYDGTIVDSEYEESQDAFIEDGYSIDNDVTANLFAIPTLDQIQSVEPSFDPYQHYIVWYVIKKASTAAPNSDVGIHVDGVIRTRVNSKYNVEPLIEPEQPIEPEKPGPGVVEETVSSEYTFNIYTKNFEPSFEYDGEEHLIGGFVIEIFDKKTGDLLAQFNYSSYGNLIGMRKASNSLGEGDTPLGTVFSFAGNTYRVNVDGAYLSVKNPGQYSIPFRLGGEIISPDEIRIWDESGKLIDTGISKTPKENSDVVEVSKRNITITAGTTVQNDDGKTLTNGDVKVTAGSLVSGHTLVTTILGSQTGPGTSLNEITDYDIVDENGRSVKEYYNVNVVNGKLVVVAVSNGSDKGTNSTGSAVTSIIVKDGEKTVINNVQVSLGSQADGEKGKTYVTSSDTPAVLGARRGDTSDQTTSTGVRLGLIISCMMIILLINISRNKQNKS